MCVYLLISYIRYTLVTYRYIRNYILILKAHSDPTVWLQTIFCLISRFLYPSKQSYYARAVWIEQKPQYWQLKLVTKAAKYKFRISTWMNPCTWLHSIIISCFFSVAERFFLLQSRVTSVSTYAVTSQLSMPIGCSSSQFTDPEAVSSGRRRSISYFLCTAVGFSCRRYFEWTVKWTHFVCRYEVKTFSL